MWNTIIIKKQEIIMKSTKSLGTPLNNNKKLH